MSSINILSTWACSRLAVNALINECFSYTHRLPSYHIVRRRWLCGKLMSGWEKDGSSELFLTTIHSCLSVIAMVLFCTASFCVLEFCHPFMCMWKDFPLFKWNLHFAESTNKLKLYGFSFTLPFNSNYCLQKWSAPILSLFLYESTVLPKHYSTLFPYVTSVLNSWW